MIEFGAKLSLKDNMSATLQKNLKQQQKFSSQVNKTSGNLKKLGKTKVNPIVKLKDMASGALSKVSGGLKAVGKFIATPFIKLKDNATKSLEKMKSLLKGLAKGATIGLKVAGAGLGLLTAGAGAIAGGAIAEGAKLQQSKGGVETLYKGKEGDGGVVDTVIANANMAYKTAGLSANAYMETVTGFSASLLSSLGGDTAKSAQIADMAIIDMADNANKFGTDMESIKTAYSGFAKQNYTMLDNLKLGYGGTKEEMQRLLKDAQKITGVKYDISNLADVYSAIHEIQDDLGVAGATFNEAETTFSGSFSAMKSSFQNFLGALATGGNVDGTIEQMVSSASTFLINNAIPMIAKIFTSLPSAIVTAVKQGAPKLKEAGVALATGVKDGLMAILPSSAGGALERVFEQIKGLISDLMGSLSFNADMGSFLSIEGVLNGVADVIKIVRPIVSSLGALFSTMLPIIGNVVKSVIPVIEKIFSGMGDKIGKVVGVIQEHSGLFESLLTGIGKVIGVVWDVASPIIDIAIEVVGEILSAVEKAFPTIQAIIEKVWEFLQPVFEALTNGLKLVGDALGGVASFIGEGIESIGNFFGFAYGKDRVPYDNYPAILHQGERVLTRNQADQYDRLTSTRGVSVGSTLASPSAGSPTGGNNITIEKLADTVVIEKDADVDKVVEGMITKFRKLVPNMA